MKLGKHLSDSLFLSTGVPQGCVLSPVLYSLCTSNNASVKLLKFADDTTLVVLITDGDEYMYCGEVNRLVAWCSRNNLELNTDKTVEMLADLRKRPPTISPPQDCWLSC